MTLIELKKIVVKDLKRKIKSDKKFDKRARAFYLFHLGEFSNKATTFKNAQQYMVEAEKIALKIRSKMRERRTSQDNIYLVSMYHLKFLFEILKISQGYTTTSADLIEAYAKYTNKKELEVTALEVPDEEEKLELV